MRTISKNALFRLIADLVEMLIEYGCDTDTIVKTLKYNGFTKEQIVAWYGLSTDDKTNG